MAGETGSNNGINADVILIGAGIMSATLGVMLKELDPGLRIQVYERLDMIAGESSDAWNNAGTGHSALCELNYTPQRPDGSVDCSKAYKIFEQFQQTLQFWSYLKEQGHISNPKSFINSIPHISFVRGESNVNYLKARFEELSKSPFFKEMVYSEDPATIQQWAPLVMDGRDAGDKVAATAVQGGTDVNFGALSRELFAWLQQQPNVELFMNFDVLDIDKEENGSWTLEVKDNNTSMTIKTNTRFVFIGAGGGALHLLEKSKVEESKGYGGFPVSGQWLKCTNEAVIERHHAKVYGKAAVGAPPMSVPHLDARIIDGKKELLFGPYAGFSTRFLKHGSRTDLFTSLTLSNLYPMVKAGWDNIPLTKYLISQVRQSPEDRLEALKEYFPEAKMEDWELEIAGQRVQVIKKDEHKGGVLEFGTEVVASADGSIAALLGASPGASTAVSIMVELLEKCFGRNINSPAWQHKLKQMIPSYKESLKTDTPLFERLRQWTTETLELNN